MMLPTILRHAEKDSVQLSSVSRSVVLRLWSWDHKVEMQEGAESSCLLLKAEHFNAYLLRPAWLFFPLLAVFSVFWLSKEAVNDLVSFQGKSNFTHVT